MAYIINNSRGQVLAVVADGTVNTSATSLSLVGRAVSEYGTAENENYVFLLENFANDTAPFQPVLGQLWYNSSSDELTVYDNTNSFAPLASQAYVQLQKISPIFSGTPTAPTAAPGTATLQLATTAFVTNNPEFAGVPRAPTAPPGTNSTQIASTAFVTNSPQLLGVPTAPTAASGTATTQLATTEFVTSSPTFTGNPRAPTAATLTGNTQIATTEFVQNNKTSPVLVGVPIAPTASNLSNTQQIATTAFVQGEKVSPQFTGIPIAPTANVNDISQQIATTAFVRSITGNLGTMSQQNANSVTITGGSVTGISPLDLAFGGTGASNAAAARNNLGLGSMALQNTNAVNISGGEITGIVDLTVADGGTGASSAAGARTNLGLGSISTQNFNSVSITGGDIIGINPLPIGSGGTAAGTVEQARVNLGLGGMAVQAPNGVFISGGSLDSVTVTNVAIIGGVITNITDLALVDGGTGASNPTQARDNLGITALFNALGNMSVQNNTSVSIAGGTITNITDLALADGGTGASTAQQARANLGAAAATITVSAGVGLTGGGDLTLDRSLRIADDSNGFGVRFVSTQDPNPAVGQNGDIWYQI